MPTKAGPEPRSGVGIHDFGRPIRSVSFSLAWSSRSRVHRPLPHNLPGSGADTLIISPQFLTGTDITAHHLSGQILHWSLTGWEGGEPAQGPTPASSFDAFDTILMHLSDRQLFPNLTTVVIAGHSGGAQVVQRYAVLRRGETYAKTAGIHIRYVVANPSSYAWFGVATSAATRTTRRSASFSVPLCSSGSTT
jgi:pimeloyl-ACP methyl ester carboxylesterase